MKAIIYARKSKFSGKGNSIENQIQFCKNYCQILSIDDIEIYYDENCSGANMDRSEFKKMMNYIHNNSNECTHFICYKVDRVSRNVQEFLSFISELDELGINFISASQSMDMSTPTGRLVLSILAGFAEFELEMIRERIIDNIYSLAKNGWWLGGQYPLGFVGDVVELTDNYGKKSQYTKLKINDEEMNIVKVLFQKYTELKSLSRLKTFCYDNGIKSSRNNFFDTSALSLILRNPVYVKSNTKVLEYLKLNRGMDVYGEPDNIHGLLTYGKQRSSKIKNKKKLTYDSIEDIGPIAATAQHEGVISAEDWLYVQHILDEKSDLAPRSGTGKASLLSGLLKCGICGKSMRIAYKYHNDKTIKNYYYICSTKKKLRANACNCKNIPGKTTDNYVLDSIKSIDVTEFAKFYLKISKDTLSEIESAEKSISDIYKEINDTKKKINNLVIKLSENSNPVIEDIISEQIVSFTEDIESLEYKRDSLLSKIDSLKNEHLDVSSTIDSINNFDSILLGSTIEEKRILLNSIIDEIKWYPSESKLEIKYIGSSEEYL